MTSHEYAKKMVGLAEKLLAAEAFDMPSHASFKEYFFYYSEKDRFLSAVRALGSGEKVWKDSDLQFLPALADDLILEVSRSVVCRKVQEEKWECEPLLSQAEEAEIGA